MEVWLPGRWKSRFPTHDVRICWTRLFVAEFVCAEIVKTAGFGVCTFWAAAKEFG